MTLLKTLKNNIDGRYKFEESKIIECIDRELICLEEKSRDVEDTIFYIEDYWYKEGLYEMFMDSLYTENEKAKDEELKEWTEGLVDSITPDELTEYYFQRHREISIERHKTNLKVEYICWLKEIDSKYDIHPDVLSFVRSEMDYYKNIYDSGGNDDYYRFVLGILKSVREDEYLSKLINLQYGELTDYDELIESMTKYIKEIETTGMMEPVIF